MNYTKIIQGLSRNREIFKGLFTGLSEEEYLWKSNFDKWCLLEIICHLFDEEREDFRARLRHVLKTPTEPLPPTDPAGWVKERNYISKNYKETMGRFLEERQQSVKWLKSLTNPK